MNTMTPPSFLLLFFTICLMQGCFPPPEQDSHQDSPVFKQITAPNKNSTKTQKNTHIAAQSDNKTILMQDVDAQIQLRLFDMEEAIYQLRKSQLVQILENEKKTQIKKYGFASEFTIELYPPDRPRVTLPHDNRPVRGNSDAPVQLAVFCSYQSSHCVRLQPVLIQLLQQFGDNLQVKYFDNPQPFHRYGFLLAEALRCASEQKMQWTLQDHLLARVDTIDSDKLFELAQHLKLDTHVLQQCMTSHKYRAAIESDIKLAHSLGISTVPVMFVNGLYIRHQQPEALLTKLINAELELQIYETENNRYSLSTLPIKLLASTVSNNPKLSTALLKVKQDSADYYQPGAILIEDVELISVNHQSVLIKNKDRIELIRLWDGKPRSLSMNTLDKHSMLLTAQSNSSDINKRNLIHTHENGIPETGGYTLPDPVAVLPISRAWLEKNLLNQQILEQQIEHAEHQVEGNYLIRLTEEKLDAFYQTLGFEPGDVLMMVNNQWAHSNHNPLWEQLRDGNQVKAVVMRNGFPVVYEYNISDIEQAP